MMFGRSDTFAIEVHLSPGLEAGRGLWGRIGIWWAGSVLGDLNESHNALFPAYRGARAVRDRDAHAWNNFLVNWGVAFDMAGEWSVVSRDGSAVSLVSRHSHELPDVPLDGFTTAISEFLAWFEMTESRLATTD